MANLSKRATVYFDPDIHQALKMKAAATHVSISELIDESARQLLAEDQEDLAEIQNRISEPVITYEALLKDLKKHGKL
jgi:hypothetical protein